MQRDKLEVALLPEYEVSQGDDGAWSFPAALVKKEIGDDYLMTWNTKREAVAAGANADPWVITGYDGIDMRAESKEVAEHIARGIDGGRWYALGDVTDIDGELERALLTHDCEACEGAGATDDPDSLTGCSPCWLCAGVGTVQGWQTQADAKAWAATVSGWTLDGVTFYKHKKDVPSGASDAPSGWTVDGVTFYATKKELLDSTDACAPWQLVGLDHGPFFRIREDADAYTLALAGERIAITQRDFDRATEACDALTSHPVAGALLDAADATELSVLWHDAAEGADCSGQLDAYLANTDGITLDGLHVPPGKRIGIDLKTTGKLVAPGTESRTILDGGHHIQGAHYMDGCAANGKPLDAWLMMYVETNAPYGVRVVQLGEQYLALGRYRRKAALELVRQWRALGAEAMPPSYAPRVVTVEPPPYALPDDLDEDSWADWVNDGADAKRKAQLAALTQAADAADHDLDRIGEELDALLAGRQDLAAQSVALAKAGDYGAACALSDGFAATQDGLLRLRTERAQAAETKAAAYAALQAVLNG